MLEDDAARRRSCSYKWITTAEISYMSEMLSMPEIMVRIGDMVHTSANYVVYDENTVQTTHL